MKKNLKQLSSALLFLIFTLLLSGGAAFAIDCAVGDAIRCNFDGAIFAMIEEEQVTVSQIQFGQNVQLTSISFFEILNLLDRLTQAGNQLVEDEKMTADADFLEFIRVIKDSDEYPELAAKVLDNGGIFLASSADNKATIYLLGTSGELQINIGPDIEGKVQVLVMSLFTSPVFYEDVSFNIYEIDFDSLNS